MSANDEEEAAINPMAHARMLKAIGNLSRNQHISKYVRDENKAEQGEFNLCKGAEVHVASEEQSGDAPGLQWITSKRRHQPVGLKDIIQVLNRNEKHLKVGKRLKDVNATKRVLPKPLTKPVADRIKRGIGYEKLQRKLARWDAVVAKNRNTEHQVFPSNSETIYVNTATAKGKSEFAVKTDLMLQMEETDNKLKALQRKKIGDTDNPAELHRIEMKLLQENCTREELVARLREMKYLKIRESEKCAKARLRNRIKSKKYHKLLKRQKLKKEMENFELLQKTDPEAALEKLRTLEKSRILERASLRHKNTGLWAKNLQVRAKYNKDVRRDLAEQLKTSRELTRKLEDNDSDDNDFESGFDEENNVADDGYNDGMAMDTSKGDPGEDKAELNPWIQNTKKQTKTDKKQLGEESWRKYWLKHNTQMALDSSSNNKQIDDDDDDNDNMKNSSMDETTIPAKTLQDTERSKEPKQKKQKKKKGLALSKKVETADKQSTSTLGKQRKEKKGEETGIIKGQSVDIDDIFDEKQKRIQMTLEHKMQALKKNIDTLTQMEKMSEKPQKKNKKDKLKNLKDLSFKEPTNAPKIDEELTDNNKSDSCIRDTSEKIHNKLVLIGDKEVDKIQKGKSLPTIEEIKELSTEMSINPNIPIVTLDDNANRRKHQGRLQSINDAMGDMDMVEDNESLAGGEDEDTEMTIAEAFADDDIISDFNREKEEDSALKNTDVELGVPGWGSWAGAGISKEQMARQSKRRIFKILPKDRRRDENKEGVYINEDVSKHLRPHLVSEVPYPFTSVKDYEASIRAPLGRHFVSETSFRLLTKPSVITKKGQVIAPMDDSELIKRPTRPLNSVDVRIAQMKAGKKQN